MFDFKIMKHEVKYKFLIAEIYDSWLGTMYSNATPTSCSDGKRWIMCSFFHSGFFCGGSMPASLNANLGTIPTWTSFTFFYHLHI